MTTNNKGTVREWRLAGLRERHPDLPWAVYEARADERFARGSAAWTNMVCAHADVELARPDGWRDVTSTAPASRLWTGGRCVHGGEITYRTPSDPRTRTRRSRARTADAEAVAR